MKCLKCVGLLRISWTEKRTNEWVFQSAGTERQMLKSVKNRKMTYFGYIITVDHANVGRGGALVETMTFNRSVVGSTPALAAT